MCRSLVWGKILLSNFFDLKNIRTSKSKLIILMSIIFSSKLASRLSMLIVDMLQIWRLCIQSLLVVSNSFSECYAMSYRANWKWPYVKGMSHGRQGATNDGSWKHQTKPTIVEGLPPRHSKVFFVISRRPTFVFRVCPAEFGEMKQLVSELKADMTSDKGALFEGRVISCLKNNFIKVDSLLKLWIFNFILATSWKR